jgi:hypothetical protein
MLKAGFILDTLFPCHANTPAVEKSTCNQLFRASMLAKCEPSTLAIEAVENKIAISIFALTLEDEGESL